MSVTCVKIEPNNETDKILYKYALSVVRPAFGEFGSEKIILPICYQNIAEEVEKFDVRDSDIFVASYPKAGTTWCQEMVWQIVNNIDFEQGRKVLLSQRFPFLEFAGIFDHELGRKLKAEYNPPNFYTKTVNAVKNSPSNPRLIKTHLSWSLLPRQIRDNKKNPKIIYVSRNAKDLCVSYYYHSILIEGYRGDFDSFYKLFMSGRINYGFFWDHIRGYWAQRNKSNLLFITYENMKQNLPSVIKRVAKFLDKSLTEEQIYKLTEHLSFENMKNNPGIKSRTTPLRVFFDNDAKGLNFMRCGIVGSYKADMSQEMIRVFDEWIEENSKKIGFSVTKY